MKPLRERDFHFHKAARGSRVHGCYNCGDMRPDQTPPSLTQHYNRNPATGKILLVAEILIGSDQRVKPRSLGCIQQIAILQFMPPAGSSLSHHVVVDQKSSKGSRCTVVEEDQH